MPKIVEINVFDFNIFKVVEKDLDTKDQEIMNSLPKFYNITIMTDEQCFYMLKLKNILKIERMSKKIFNEIKKNLEQEKENIIGLNFEYDSIRESISNRLQNKLIKLLIKN
ncbi:hypothetical protein QT384_11015 (plasmid) [Arcobacter cryaerophilus gv. pseudocryaerophilus]|uniref:Uncharacterized protein n=3 Tax=Arcobacteraceae TaxID=2808963 RepID=A0AA96DWZ7_9BACT|nr:hypothetical protein RMP68_11015 [Arcobacter sp. AZ-2023]WNL37329.1 hypothetical protein RMQ66_11015 [Arcobacter sp. AZ-2023]WPD13044.1 hypothetical protein QT384_11015 [Arcobacter sp. DSM 115960]